MTRSPRPPRAPSNLSESVHRLLNMYTLAASAAGVSLLASVQPAEAKIVYTKVHQVIGPGGSYKLDLNHDGITDFTILEVKSATSRNCLCVYPPPFRLKENGIMGYYTAYHVFWASALSAGVSIDGKDIFRRGGNDGVPMIYSRGYKVQGKWVNGTGYLGLKFFIHGKRHFGWARLSVKLIGLYDVRAVLTGYAYETIPNKAIITGKTSGSDADDQPAPASLKTHISETTTLGALALGAPGLAIWKREESASPVPKRT